MSEVGGPKLGLMNIGEEAKPPFAVLPDPSSLFLNRSKRLAALAPKHELEPYLRFPRAADAGPARHPAGAAAAGPAPVRAHRPGAGARHAARSRARCSSPTTWPWRPSTGCWTGWPTRDVPAQTAAAIAAVRGAVAGGAPQIMAAAALKDVAGRRCRPARAGRGRAAGALRAARRACSTADDLKPVADGACPVCGSAPMTSSVVGWPKAHNTRFCTCSLCATMWNVVRVKCVLCSSTERHLLPHRSRASPTRSRPRPATSAAAT